MIDINEVYVPIMTVFRRRSCRTRLWAGSGQGARKRMRRIIPLIVIAISLTPAFGCEGLAGWYRAVGHIPGVAATDYAYYDFFGTSSQLYPSPPPAVESSLIEGLGDLGFKILEPPKHDPGGESLIHAHTPDGRSADIMVIPQNALTNVRVKIGPVHVGDEALSHELLRRVSLGLGTVMRAYTPIDTTLPRRINVSRGLPPRIEQVPPKPLEGEGLRPNEKRDKPIEEEEEEPGLEDLKSAPVPGVLEQFVPTRDFPNPPNMPHAPFPYDPFTPMPE